jgi:hypothetical protein
MGMLVANSLPTCMGDEKGKGKKGKEGRKRRHNILLLSEQSDSDDIIAELPLC